MMTGIITLSENVLCKKEVLGRTYSCEIGGITAKLHFPNYPQNIDMNNHLESPASVNGLKDYNNSITWGCLMVHPKGDSCVNKLAITVECEMCEADDFAEKIFKSVWKWEHAFIDYLRLATKQGVYRDKNLRRNTCDLELFNYDYIPKDVIATINLRIPKEIEFANENDINNAIKFADSGREMLFEYQMLLSSYDAIRNNQNRRAILDACAALEIVLSKQIVIYCGLHDVPEKLLLNKYRYLSEKINLLRIIDSDFPQVDLDNSVIIPRNALMHSTDVYPTDDITDRLISCVKQVLNYYHKSYY